MTNHIMYQYETYQSPILDNESSQHHADKVSTFTGNSQQNEYYDVNSRQTTFDHISSMDAEYLPEGEQIHIDDFHLESLLLSDILKTCPTFSFFDELINIKSIEQAQTLLHYDLIKINNSILDISTYLNELILLLQNLDTITNNSSPLNKYYDNIEWIYEGRSEITKISKNVDGIDSIISQLLHIIESKLDETTNDEEFFDEHGLFDHDSEGHVHGHNCEKKKLEYLHLLSNFDEISDLSLQVKKYLIVYKKRLDISVQYNELYYQILESVNDEIENCLKDSFKTHELKFSLSTKSIEQYNISSLAEKIDKILDALHDISKRKSAKDLARNSNSYLHNDLLSLEASTRYPIFDDKERELYDHLSRLKSTIDPIKASIDYIKPQVRIYSEKEEIIEFYPTSIENLNIKFDTIEEKFIFLINDLDDLRYELVEKRWLEAFQFLISSVETKTEDFFRDLLTVGLITSNADEVIDKNVIIPLEFEDEFKQLHAVVKVIKKGFGEKLFEHERLKQKFEETALPQWNVLYKKVPPELKSIWFGIKQMSERKSEHNPAHNLEQDVLPDNSQLLEFNRKASNDEVPTRALKIKSMRNSLVPSPTLKSSVQISSASPHLSRNRFDNTARKDTYRSPSLSSVVSPTTESDFQVRSFSLSRSNTIHQISSFADMETNNDDAPIISGFPSPENIDTGGFGLGLNTFNHLANGVQSTPGPETTNEKRHSKRRSITGSLLIGKMNLQPILVQGTPTSPEKSKHSQGLSQQQSEHANKEEAAHVASPKPLKTNKFSGIVPRVGLTGNRGLNVLSTVESIADEDSSFADDDRDTSLESPLSKKVQRIGGFDTNSTRHIFPRNENAVRPPTNFHNIDEYDISNVSNVSSIEHSRLEALKKLESQNEKIEVNILDGLENLTLEDLQKTLKSKEENEALPPACNATLRSSKQSLSESNSPLNNSKIINDLHPRNSPRTSLYSQRSSISRLPIANRGLSSKKFSIVTSPTTAKAFIDDPIDTAVIDHRLTSSFVKMDDRQNSSAGSIASDSPYLGRKSSLVPVPAAQVSRIKSPDSQSNSFSFHNQSQEEHIYLSDNSNKDIPQNYSPSQEAASRTMDRIKKLKKNAENKSLWIPQPKTVLSRSLSLKGISESSSTTDIAAMRSGSNKTSNTGKPKKRNSNGRAKIIARKEFV